MSHPAKASNTEITTGTETAVRGISPAQLKLAIDTFVGLASITNAKLADMATKTLKGRTTAGTGVPEDITILEALNFFASIAHGDILYRGATDFERLPAGTSGKVLMTQGAGAAPIWNPVPPPVIVTESGSTYTLTVADCGTWMRFSNVGGCLVTFDGTGFAGGEAAIIMEDIGGGQITLVESGTTINKTDTLLSRTQYSVIGLQVFSPTVATLFGDTQT